MESWTWDSGPEKRALSSILIDCKSMSFKSDTDFITAAAGFGEH